MTYLDQLREFLTTHRQLRLSPLSRLYGPALQLEQLGEVSLSPTPGSSTVTVEMTQPVTVTPEETTP